MSIDEMTGMLSDKKRLLESLADRIPAWDQWSDEDAADIRLRGLHYCADFRLREISRSVLERRMSGNNCAISNL
jgi:hypothetical protein